MKQHILSICALVAAANGLLAPSVARAENATPSPDALKYFNGEWDCAGEFPASGKKIASTVRFTYDEPTGALVKHHDDNPPNAYHAIELWAADKSGTFSNTIAVPSYGVRTFTSPGWSDNAFVWTSGVNANPTERFTYTRLGDATMQVDWAISKNGATFVVGDTLTCNRRG
jgi:hypothetical protein